ncbi:velvet factor-domain-containing protein [Leucosporidium creatinivorum]|uniref:Velvet factor-domain-containing protein n=1 Tax=Leucosporidium creatinivorum TaxID=106004 RepID=A0A1Y2E2E6_9BASI|nr:velvet factor-domain-containing protein [Leucosporidium creatinivorum]
MSRESKKGTSPSAGTPSSSSSSTRGRSSARQQTARSSRGATSSASSAASTPAPAPSRMSRRRSLDPYARPPPPANDPSDDREQEERPVTESVPEEPAEEVAEVPMQEEVAQQEEEEPAEQPPNDDTNFELVVVQQPEIGAEAGMDKVTLGRLPIVPAPVVQVFVRNADGQQVDTELPYLFCSCSLRQEDGINPVELAQPAAESGAEGGEQEEFSALIGNLVRNAHRVPDLEGNPGSFFVFEDMSVRTTGRFTLEFRLGEARPKSPKLAAAISSPFNVVPWQEYPGRPAADTVTDLSRHLHEHGVPMYIPPLVLGSGLEPPPAGSNPFPADMAPPNMALATPP